LALSPGQAQTEVATSENTKARTLGMPFMGNLRGVGAESLI
jgi:hypothetical protein